MEVKALLQVLSFQIAALACAQFSLDLQLSGWLVLHGVKSTDEPSVHTQVSSLTLSVSPIQGIPSAPTPAYTAAMVEALW